MVTSHSNGRCGGLRYDPLPVLACRAVWCYCGLEMGEVVAFCTANVFVGMGWVWWCAVLLEMCRVKVFCAGYV
ncbi:hypothetical protein Pmani_027154 [Petrolisthes manimaculis]|uniref:Transmembrane protein n=1 Tax=Petrolisthes manimaculis TaxID=1843537 RepID=A0AAE1P286_9EUCA|nr:hypothetical protein Pmani_027154 [Petrolisthes manimaculis]